MATHKLTQEMVISLSQRLSLDKADIEKRLAKGATMVDVAARYKVPVQSWRRIARAVGINLPSRNVGRSKSKLLFHDILTVIARIAEEAQVNYDEIKPYLEESDGTAGE